MVVAVRLEVASGLSARTSLVRLHWLLRWRGVRGTEQAGLRWALAQIWGLVESLQRWRRGEEEG